MSYKEGRGWDYKFNFFLRRDETNHSTPRCRMSREGKMMAPSSAEGGPCPGSRMLAAPSRAVVEGSSLLAPSPGSSAPSPWTHTVLTHPRPVPPRSHTLQAYMAVCLQVDWPSQQPPRQSEIALTTLLTWRGCAAFPRAGNTRTVCKSIVQDSTRAMAPPFCGSQSSA